MMGISTLGWIHTLGSLPAIPLAAYMFARHGRIMPRSVAGVLYLAAMLLGAGTVFLIARQPVSVVIGAATLLVLVTGYGVEATPLPPRLRRYIETIALSVSAFLLMVPTVNETLTRVPAGAPLASGPTDPLVLSAQGLVLLALIAGLAAQVVALRREGRALRTRPAS